MADRTHAAASIRRRERRERGVGALLRLYPAAWRTRYQDELEAVLEQHTITFATIVDLLWGALDARLDPAFTSERMFRPMSRLRASAVALFLAFAAFTLSYIAFNRLTDPRAPFLAAAQSHPELLVAMNVIDWAAAIGMLALALGGVPIALDIALRAWRERRWLTLGFLALPVVLFAAAAVFTHRVNSSLALLIFRDNGNFVIAPGDIAALIILGALLIGGGLVSTVVVGWIVARSQISASVLRFARWPALLLTLCMATATGALIYWDLQTFAVARWLYGGYASACAASCPGVWDTNWIDLPGMVAIAAWMLLMVIVAGVYLTRSITTPQDGAITSASVAPAQG